MRKQGSQISEDYKPNSEQIAWATEKFPFVDLETETDKFVDHFLATGKIYVSWNAAWRNWIRRAFEYHPEYRTGASRTTMGRHTQSNADRIAAALFDDDDRGNAGNTGSRAHLRLVARQ